MGHPDDLVERRAPSMARLIVDRVTATPDREALRYRDGETWRSLTWAETGDRARALAAGLLSLGIRPEDTVGIAATTRLEWILADFAVMCAGAATTTVYPTTPEDDVAYILADAGCRVVFAEDAAQLAKLRARRDELRGVERVVLFDGDDADSWVLTLAELAARGREHLTAHPTAVDDAVGSVGPEHLATLIYTSGTTGRPKGVRLVHECWCYEAAAVDALGLLDPGDLQYLWLPLSHSFGKMMLSVQLQIGFPTAVDGDVTRIVDNIGVIRPTFMCAAPRIFEKAHARVVATAAAEGGAKKEVFDWAVAVGRRVVEERQAGRALGVMLAAQHRIADKLVFAKLRARFGGRLRFFVSGSAALSADIARFFAAAGMPILEGYGLTETSAACCVNRPQRNRVGTVGPPLPGTELRMGDDGEVLVRGPGVMRGYHGLPEQTAAALEPNGWLHTGDIGELDEAGHLRITDRKKDLIKTSHGKFVAPQPIETRFKALCGLASHVVVHGDGRSFVTALVALDPDALAQWAAAHGHAGEPYERLVALPEVREQVTAAIKQLNEALPRWETVKKFEILPRDLSIDQGELTPSLKVKRRAVEQRYRHVLDRLYADVPAQV